MKWKLFADLAEVTDERIVEVNQGKDTAGGALEALLELHPDLRDRVLNDSGDLAEHVNLLVNGTHVSNESGLETHIEPEDELALIPPVSGG